MYWFNVNPGRNVRGDLVKLLYPKDNETEAHSVSFVHVHEDDQRHIHSQHSTFIFIILLIIHETLGLCKIKLFPVICPKPHS